METRWQRLGLQSGVVFVLLQVGAFIYFAIQIFPNFAAVDAPAAERAAAIVRLGNRLRLGNFLLVLPSPFFLFFLGALAGVWRRVRPNDDTIAMASLAGGAAMALVWPMGAVISDIELDLALSGGDAATVSALDAMAPYTLALGAAARTVFVAVNCIPLLGVPGAVRWAGWFGVAIAALSFIGSATLVIPSLFPILAIGSLLFDVWLLTFCLAWLRGWWQQASARRV